MSDNTSHITQEFKAQAIYRIDLGHEMLKKAVSDLDEDMIWSRPNGVSNSIGNLILHLCGNITQYAISGLGGALDERHRDLEFSSRETHTKLELLQKLEETLEGAKGAISGATDNDFLHIKWVQGFEMSGLGMALHVVEHFSYHTGQIAFWVKQLKNEPLGFYDGIDLNLKNK
ncbi:MAG: DinB family protein [Sediminicola sp.]|tara:strand:+ start:22174 stop:22692 length:519 start_codon:yes stop_codon:yes gene_type:complete